MDSFVVCGLLFDLFLPLSTYSASIQVPLIIDTDIGTDFDDTMALSYALSRNDVFDIKLVLTATYNTTGRAQLLAKFLDVTNRTDIDIGIGLATPSPNDLQGGVGAQMPWAYNYNLNKYPGTVHHNGISQANKILNAASPQFPVYFMAIAPLTNLGQLLTQNPHLKSNMRLITMAGSIYKGYGTNYPQMEYNIYKNITAAQITYNYTDDIPYVNKICSSPLDTTYYFQIYGDNYQKILKSTELVPTVLIENYNVWYANLQTINKQEAYRPFSPTTATSTMYDAQTVFMGSILAMNSTHGLQSECDSMPFMEMQGLRIIINDTGYTVINTESNNTEINYEAINYKGGEWNGSYPLGEYIANVLINPQ